MRAEELILTTLEKINAEVQELMEKPDYSSLIGDIIAEDLDSTNYNEMIDNHIAAIDKLMTNQLAVKFNIKNILLVLKYIDEISDNIEISDTYSVCSVNSEILNDLFIDDCEIKNIYLERSKNLIISKVHEEVNSYLEHLSGEANSLNNMISILKALIDNFDFNLENDSNRIIFLSNCSADDIEIFKSNNKELISYLKLCILADGKSFHKHYSLINQVSTIPPCTQQDKNYYQYNEIFYILSEYNYSNDLLNKYFLLYTIIENFMYRYPISKMLRNQSQEFSIRDFKRFYSSIDSNESQKITELIDSILNIDLGSQNLHDELEDNLTEFLGREDINETELMKFLVKIGVSNKRGEINRAIYCENLNKYFAKTIYHLRNSILHNTATEFHITHYELSKCNELVTFLSELIIPYLERVILYLIHQSHEIISYNHSSLVLYEE